MLESHTYWSLENFEKLSQETQQNAVHLSYSENKLAGTWWYEESGWECRMWFYCPLCGVGWKYEFSYPLELVPQWHLLNCFEFRGCGTRSYVIFDRKVE